MGLTSLLDRLRLTTRAVGVTVLRLVEDDDGIRIDEPVTAGPAWLATEMASLQGARYAEVAGEADACIGDGMAGLGKVRRTSRQRIARHASWAWLADRAVASVLGVVVVSGSRIRGAVLLFCGPGSTRDAEKLLQQAAIADHLCRGRPERAFALMLDARGAAVPGCDVGRRWLDHAPGRAAAVTAQADRGILGGARVRRVPAALVPGVEAILLVEPLPSPVVPAMSLLSPTQRRIAGYAAAGATLSEAATAAGMAVETARSHLRSVYRRLDVASRVELAETLRDGAPAWLL